MACACKVNKELSYLQRKYGVGGPKQKKTNINGNLINYLKDIFVKLSTILLFPLLIIHVMVLSRKGNGLIQIDKLWGMKNIRA